MIRLQKFLYIHLYSSYR